MGPLEQQLEGVSNVSNTYGWATKSKPKALFLQETLYKIQMSKSRWCQMVIYDYGRYLRCLHESSKYGICPRGELFPSERANGRQLRFIGGTTPALVKVYLTYLLGIQFPCTHWQAVNLNTDFFLLIRFFHSFNWNLPIREAMLEDFK